MASPAAFHGASAAVTCSARAANVRRPSSGSAASTASTAAANSRTSSTIPSRTAAIAPVASDGGVIVASRSIAFPHAVATAETRLAAVCKRSAPSIKPAWCSLATASPQAMIISTRPSSSARIASCQPAIGAPNAASSSKTLIARSTICASVCAVRAACSSGSTTCGRTWLPEPPGRVMLPSASFTSPSPVPRSPTLACQAANDAPAWSAAATPAASIPAIAA